MTRGPSSTVRAREHFFRALERVTTLDEAWRFVLSGPKLGQPGADHTSRLALFLKHLVPPPAATREERQAYLALVRRFLSSSAIDETTGKRAIAVLMEKS